MGDCLSVFGIIYGFWAVSGVTVLDRLGMVGEEVFGGGISDIRILYVLLFLCMSGRISRFFQ